MLLDSQLTTLLVLWQVRSAQQIASSGVHTLCKMGTFLSVSYGLTSMIVVPFSGLVCSHPSESDAMDLWTKYGTTAWRRDK